MLAFVNAKINIGLYVTSKRPDGYHDLETVFYPVGVAEGLVGTSASPHPFCDIIEYVASEEDNLVIKGRHVDCPLDKNLVWRAISLFRDAFHEKKGVSLPPYHITLLKNLPDGAGLGGGSADATFTLRVLNTLCDYPFSDTELEDMALRLGADCPFFVRNHAAYAAGVGERLEDISLSLDGWWIVIAKPRIHISTREAFAGMMPAPAPMDLRTLASLSPYQWKEAGVFNQFETTLFPLYPELSEVKEKLYASGAVYASMSGSGAALYGLYPSREKAENGIDALGSTLEGVWLLELK